MSIVRCDRAGCERVIDTDKDDECVVPDPRHSIAGHPDLILCRPCRERGQDDIEPPAVNVVRLDGHAIGCGSMK